MWISSNYNVLQSKFGCTTVLHGVDATCAGQSRKPSVFPEERFSIHLSKSFKVSVWKDDLTSHRVDAEVNAANNWLKHCAGLAKALSDAGGPAIQQDGDQYIFRKGKLSIGDAIMLNLLCNIAPPGYLPCRKIIHAVGPNRPYNNIKSEVDNVTPQLQRAVLSILKVVKQDNLQSVAIPAISSGLFNYPLPLCADVIVKILKEYHASNYSGAPLEVRLVNHDEPSVREMERACRQILGSSGSHSQPVEAQGQPPKASYSQAARSHGKGSTKPFSTPTVQLGNVSLTIKKGYIEREQVKISIVNTISNDLHLSTGVISKAILKAADQGIQKEMWNYLKNNHKYGDVIETQGHKLRCKYVYHTICPHKSQASEKSLGDIVSKCLSMAQKRQLSSISFPAIGTGVLGFSKQEVAKIMMDTAVTFSQHNNGMNMDIFIGVRASMLELEAIFCKVQEDFAKKEECDMGLKSSNNFSRTVEKVENSTLKHLFELKKSQFQSASSQRMYQRLPAQYCDLASRVGFQREYAPPDEQNHGEGIYFGSSVHGTEKLWRGLADEEYLYFFAAQVLTGKSTIGTPGLIVPPETPGGDPLTQKTKTASPGKIYQEIFTSMCLQGA
ncbi:LOW QUALITY PROTEIN: protein mono-ADP-ribosyltransferase PARP9-like [Oncorhynchus keta]|uniref:LOW QUALITY PROTEIN: protein mono-ADP-ribosyltransferase PARP9-like n=1 Tax=Oncorhynchus keta TaxID=8018 RepID=UPI00227B431E|nr:LOW QUALITY PROTEIN: protein mono-ADP-ribosyltransferase PARP9-like [Oncorhynchus keta]